MSVASLMLVPQVSLSLMLGEIAHGKVLKIMVATQLCKVTCLPIKSKIPQLGNIHIP